MGYNRVRTPKFYIDAILLARQLGHIESENAEGFFYLNPVQSKAVERPDSNTKNISLSFTSRRYVNSLTHAFILGHNQVTANVYSRFKPNMSSTAEEVSTNGWTKFNLNQLSDTELTGITYELVFQDEDIAFVSIGDISAGWSYEMPHSPDLELTQSFVNESLKVQTTKGGSTLTNTGWNQPPRWGDFPQWRRSSHDIEYPARRKWSLKFSYLNDENDDNSALMPQYYTEQDSLSNNRGIIERISTDNFSIKNDFLSKVYSGTNSFQLPFIFQPDKDVEEYAIARVNANSVDFKQVANNVYDISLDIIEVW